MGPGPERSDFLGGQAARYKVQVGWNILEVNGQRFDGESHDTFHALLVDLDNTINAGGFKCILFKVAKQVRLTVVRGTFAGLSGTNAGYSSKYELWGIILDDGRRVKLKDTKFKLATDTQTMFKPAEDKTTVGKPVGTRVELIHKVREGTITGGAPHLYFGVPDELRKTITSLGTIEELPDVHQFKRGDKVKAKVMPAGNICTLKR